MKSRLRIIRTSDLEITRRRLGRNFIYVDSDGNRITDPDILARIRSLAIPPAYTEVRIARHERDYIQAIGRDKAGRWQYRYHTDWTIIREDRKTARLLDLVSTLPKIRNAVRRDVASRKLDCNKTVACAIALIDQSHIRVGGDAYAREHGSHGAATLLKRHVVVTGSRIFLKFRGKGGKMIQCTVNDRPLARAIRRMSALSGHRMFQFLDDDGVRRPVSAGEINAYLRRVSGLNVTAKDIRMLGASARAVEALASLSQAESKAAQKRQLAAVMRDVANHLANTPTVTRKSYVPALVVKAFKKGILQAALKCTRSSANRRRAEAVLRVLATRRK